MLVQQQQRRHWWDQAVLPAKDSMAAASAAGMLAVADVATAAEGSREVPIPSAEQTPAEATKTPAAHQPTSPDPPAKVAAAKQAVLALLLAAAAAAAARTAAPPAGAQPAEVKQGCNKPTVVDSEQEQAQLEHHNQKQEVPSKVQTGICNGQQAPSSNLLPGGSTAASTVAAYIADMWSQQQQQHKELLPQKEQSAAAADALLLSMKACLSPVLGRSVTASAPAAAEDVVSAPASIEAVAAANQQVHESDKLEPLLAALQADAIRTLQPQSQQPLQQPLHLQLLQQQPQDVQQPLISNGQDIQDKLLLALPLQRQEQQRSLSHQQQQQQQQQLYNSQPRKRSQPPGELLQQRCVKQSVLKLQHVQTQQPQWLQSQQYINSPAAAAAAAAANARANATPLPIVLGATGTFPVVTPAPTVPAVHTQNMHPHQALKLLQEQAAEIQQIQQEYAHVCQLLHVVKALSALAAMLPAEQASALANFVLSEWGIKAAGTGV